MCLAVAYSQTTIFWMPLKIQYGLSPDLKWALFAVFSWSMITLIASPLILATDALIEGFVLAPTNIFTIWKNEIANLRNCENINQVSLFFLNYIFIAITLHHCAGKDTTNRLLHFERGLNSLCKSDL